MIRPNDQPKSKKELRSFGLVMTTAFGIIAGLLYWKGGETAAYLFAGLAALFLLPALLFPAVLRIPEKLWMKLAYYLSIVSSTILLGITFYLVLTPIGLVMRMFGKDLLALKRKDMGESYWVPVEKEGPASRPFKPF